METTIDLQGISKRFHTRRTSQEVQALRGLSLKVQRGEILALLGSNGAGKSTLIDIVLGLTRPTSGHVQVFGATPREAVLDTKVGAVLQSGGLLPDLSVQDTIKLIASTFADPTPVEDALRRANLLDIRTRKVQACSGGEQQRLRFALALLGSPELLILDEPTAGMDPTAREHFWQEMRREAERGATILFATHYLREAEHFAQRAVVLRCGELVADAPVTNLLREHSSLDQAFSTLMKEPS
ncbi:ABC transporter ATP-binding protein [Corynebacterium gerontici]|uniref:Putative ABC transporter ATP-binding protein YbhF n=1 Tax=Corynebacterium gerontici TaxID=2079234 RepID=A0A3G6J1R4_9CORY|nr:ABC transporter ATP-binding protein [Corynebacterium gerontici]AZA10918.1 putative ABC transporter ATP-binding protein YbhF [Corynebacterium gerontici]